MDFLISGQHIHPVFLVLVGFAIGVMGGFFGVGGSFLAGPALFTAGLPMNFVVGTDMAHMVGKSIVATRKHWVLGNVDVKLGGIMAVATIFGVELGAQAIEYLKHKAEVDLVVGISFVIVLVSISLFIGWESWQTLNSKRGAKKKQGVKNPQARADRSVYDHVPGKIHRIKLPPMVSFPKSGIKSVSLWAVWTVAFVGGIFSGFLGGGAGYIRMPALVYILGVPTHVAIGTDLFEVMISASYGTISHALKGNVDVMIALVMHTGAAVGAQIGVTLTKYFVGPWIRLAFVPLPLLGAALIAYGLLTGNHFK
jgi:uncharacterized membrane protein YfcA